ncbi:acyl-CoA/acyl-ACP dehydrogenase [Aldersonia sp. NBC_00410]|uniref:acyl-CoA dehydrogenase family protein n=1 Tax=Aldersonia sp. NBC_00410 TaxID=2975954 RepID=UPI00224E83D8|nr:acyl-CoA dehydrogenase family protein [Aldersonia sp. NBC_00410]MCX5044745.1 acyl-CoA/acyl-ACP dehydrogenase [Aldersonia sp. NBC_00410]
MNKAAPETELFLRTARNFLDKSASVSHQRALHADGRSYDPAWWEQAAGLGWAGLLVPEELGGGSVSGDGLHDLAAIAELMGATVAPGPLYPVSVVLAGLVDAENRADHASTIGDLVDGRKVASWAVEEPGRQFSPHEPTVVATRTPDGYRLDGVKDRVEAGSEADLLLVTARADDGVRQFLVPATGAGVTVRPQRSLDLVKHYARIEFDSAEVGAAAVVGTAEQTRQLIGRQSDIANVLQCAEIVGAIDTVLKLTLEWSQQRYTFGRPLASYQALKHRIADMTMWLHACRGITAGAVAEVAAGNPAAPIWVAAAKSYLGEHAGLLVQECVQLHGGIGVTWEHDLHVYLRRIALYRNMFGTTTEHHRLIARSAAEGTPAA